MYTHARRSTPLSAQLADTIICVTFRTRTFEATSQQRAYARDVTPAVRCDPPVCAMAPKQVKTMKMKRAMKAAKVTGGDSEVNEAASHPQTMYI